MNKIRLLVVDDHPVVRAGLRMLLDAEIDMEVVGEAGDGSTAVTRALELKPDIVLMDIGMKGMNGLTATRSIKRLAPSIRVLALTVHEDEEYLRQMLEAGATGYVLKDAADTELAVAVRAVHRGEVFIYPSFTRVLLGGFVQREEDLQGQDSYDQLSQREKQVLQRVALGYTNQEIAEQLYLSVKTVETYRARTMQKLSLKSRAALVRYALRRGLLDESNDDTPDIADGDEE